MNWRKWLPKKNPSLDDAWKAVAWNYAEENATLRAGMASALYWLNAQMAFDVQSGTVTEPQTSERYATDHAAIIAAKQIISNTQPGLKP